MLTGGSRDVLPRQQTLRALIDRSFDLLDDPERALFRRLGTFADDCTLENAIAVCTDDALDEFAAFDILSSLVDKSLVLADTGGETPRYRLLESTRAYAREKLAIAGELEACNARRLRCLTARASAAFEAYYRTGSEMPLRRWLTSELEDVRAALDDAFDGGGDDMLGCELLVTLSWTWRQIDLAENVARLNRARGVPIRDDYLHARLDLATATIEAEMWHSARALDLFDSALAGARRVGDVPLLADVLLGMAFLAGRRNDADDLQRAIVAVEALEPLSTAQRQLLLEARALFDAFSGDLARARLIRAFAGCGRGSRRRKSNWRGHDQSRRGGTSSGPYRPRDRRSAASDGSGRDRNEEADSRRGMNLAGYLAFVRDPAALVVGRRVLASEILLSTVPDAHVAVTFEHVALALANEGDFERAARLEGYAAAMLEREDFKREATEQMSYDALMGRLGEHLDDAALAYALAAGAALTRNAAMALALAIGERTPANPNENAVANDIR